MTLTDGINLKKYSHLPEQLKALKHVRIKKISQEDIEKILKELQRTEYNLEKLFAEVKPVPTVFTNKDDEFEFIKIPNGEDFVDHLTTGILLGNTHCFGEFNNCYLKCLSDDCKYLLFESIIERFSGSLKYEFYFCKCID